MIPITSITKDSDVIGTLNSLPTNTKHILRPQWITHPGGLDSAEFVIWIFDNLAQAEATLAYGKTFGQSALGLLLEFYGMLNPYRNSITANERVVLNIEGNMIAGASYVAKDMIIFMKEMEKYISERQRWRGIPPTSKRIPPTSKRRSIYRNFPTSSLMIKHLAFFFPF